MGKGSGTSKANVTKRPQRLSGTEAAGGSGGDGGSGTANACLVSFTADIQVNPGIPALKVGQSVTLVQGENQALDVISGGVNIGSFSGPEQSLIENCMAQGYVYKGSVKVVGDGGAACSIKGYGVQDEPANDPRH
jgi:hypothetical protein